MRIRALTPWILAVGAIASLGVGPAPVNASVVVALDLPELTAQAQGVALARVVDKRTERTERAIVTVTRLVVLESMKGDRASGDHIEVRTLGGVDGDIGMKVEGEPAFKVGQRAVVFVRRDARAALRPVGMSQGVLHVVHKDGQDMVLPSGGGLALVQKASDGSLRQAPGPLSSPERLDTFMNRVRTLVATKKDR